MEHGSLMACTPRTPPQLLGLRHRRSRRLTLTLFLVLTLAFYVTLTLTLTLALTLSPNAGAVHGGRGGHGGRQASSRGVRPRRRDCHGPRFDPLQPSPAGGAAAVSAAGAPGLGLGLGLGLGSGFLRKVCEATLQVTESSLCGFECRSGFRFNPNPNPNACRSDPSALTLALTQS